MKHTRGPSRWSRFTASLRPWRFEPAVLAIIMALFATTLVLPPSELTAEAMTSTFVRRLVFVTFIGLSTYAYFRLAQGVLRRFRNSGWVLMALSVAYGVYGQVIVNFASTPLSLQGQIPRVGASPLFFLRIATAVFIISALVGQVFNRIDAQRVHAEELQHLAEQQRRDLLSADERVRQQVGSILHDRFQSELVSSALLLRALARDADPVQQAEIESVVLRLDALHSKELRDVLLTLGPNLEHVDLQAALRQLTDQFAPAMTSEVNVDEGVDFNRSVAPVDILRGLYRISEQALLNGLKHGQATHASVTVSLTAADIVLTVTNNGRRLSPEHSPPGRGTSVINSWCSALGGSWVLSPGRIDGAMLTAHIPRADRPIAVQSD